MIKHEPILSRRVLVNQWKGEVSQSFMFGYGVVIYFITQ